MILHEVLLKARKCREMKSLLRSRRIMQPAIVAIGSIACTYSSLSQRRGEERGFHIHLVSCSHETRVLRNLAHTRASFNDQSPTVTVGGPDSDLPERDARVSL